MPTKEQLIEEIKMLKRVVSDVKKTSAKRKADYDRWLKEQETNRRLRDDLENCGIKQKQRIAELERAIVDMQLERVKK